MYMRASGASELRKFSHSKTAISISILLVLHILCRYINDTLVSLHVRTNFQLYRQNSEKSLYGGGGGATAPCPARLATALVVTPSRIEARPVRATKDNWVEVAMSWLCRGSYGISMLLLRRYLWLFRGLRPSLFRDNCLAWGVWLFRENFTWRCDRGINKT